MSTRAFLDDRKDKVHCSGGSSTAIKDFSWKKYTYTKRHFYYNFTHRLKRAIIFYQRCTPSILQSSPHDHQIHILKEIVPKMVNYLRCVLTWKNMGLDNGKVCHTFFIPSGRCCHKIWRQGTPKTHKVRIQIKEPVWEFWNHWPVLVFLWHWRNDVSTVWKWFSPFRSDAPIFHHLGHPGKKCCCHTSDKNMCTYFVGTD